MEHLKWIFRKIQYFCLTKTADYDTHRTHHKHGIPLRQEQEVVKRLEAALKDFAELEHDIAKLEAYYNSPQWRKDFEADEAGKLPKDLKRGVLSEDGIYDLLSDYQCLKDQIRTIE